jgi:GT2 family glycosyltransferase
MDYKANISVVIPTHNRVGSLLRTLKAIIKQHISPEEVVIVDDCSNDGTNELCLALRTKQLPFNLIYLRQKRNLGPAAARNLGVSVASNGIILFTDDDCEPDFNWTNEILSTFSKNQDLAGVGGPVLSAEKTKIGLFFDYHHMLDPKISQDGVSPIYLVTANAAYKREWILSVGGFSESISRPGGEDPGLSFKIASEGGCFGFSPKAIVRHHYSSKLTSISRMFFNYGYGGCYVSFINSGCI